METFDSPIDLVIIGLAIRTQPRDAAADIPALWHRFGTEMRLPKAAAIVMTTIGL